MGDSRQLFENNETLRLAERHGEFNVDSIKAAAAKSIGRRRDHVKSSPNWQKEALTASSKLPCTMILRSSLGSLSFACSKRLDGGQRGGDVGSSPRTYMTDTDSADAIRRPALKEMAWLKAHGRSRFPFERAYREGIGYQLSAPSDHERSLERYLDIAPTLLPSGDAVTKWLRLVLRHPDLNPNNIFVSDDLDIVGLIDWQHASALPLFLAAGIPKFFQNYEDPESLTFQPPTSPDLTGLDDEGRASVLEYFRRRHTHFFYLAFTQRFNEDHFSAREHPTNMFTRRIFSHAGAPWEGNNVPLQADLVLVTRAWDKYSHQPYPISLSLEEAESIMRLQDTQEDVDLDLKRARGAIGISVDGWTSNEHYEREMTD
ncbi:uncharacterized protein BDV14DRAFT_203617 [Aspergillus stella-maris]|uniref:uncharacterized protein n=1 Tax=Aspergillus stella-maris TaxID=1810926 RepID=UPI003CCD4E76